MLGATVPTIGGLHKAFDSATAWDCECLQIYLTMSRRWDSPPLTFEQQQAFLASWHASNVQEVISHVPFLVNIASPDTILWNKSVKRLLFEVKTAVELSVRFLVLHPGSPRESDREDGIRRAIEAVNISLEDADDTCPMILIETMAGQGTALGSSFEELARMLGDIEKRRFAGVCFDMAHVFAAGYDISGYEGYERVLAQFDSIVGADAIGTIHINDSQTRLGSKHDRHTYVGEGQIGLQAFHSVLRDPRFATIPKVLELPGRGDSIKDNLKFLRNLQGSSETVKDH